MLHPLVEGDHVLFNPVDVEFLGPTWQKGDNGEWSLPERTLGWQILRWVERYLWSDEVGPDGVPLPFKPTAEQARFILWWYAVDEHGAFVYRQGILQRIKGWG